MDRTPNRAVTVIVAPGGSGKTTLLRQIYEKSQRKNETCLWISLDRQDQNVDSLINTLQASFEQLWTGPAPDFAILPDSKDLRGCAEQLIDACLKYKRRINLHIDEYQHIDGTEGRYLFHRLVEMQPPNLSITIATRTPPELPLSRLQVDNRLLEFSWRDLSFSERETIDFLSSSDEINLPLESIRHIHKQTEGWAAGVQLAYLKASVDNQGFETKSRYPTLLHNAAAYFKAEIFSVFPSEIQTFLLRTSILDRMNDELAGFVAGTSAREANQIFQNLYNQGFFITNLDSTNGWKRYHHLFQDILREMLLDRSEQSKPQLELTASKWFEENALIHEAIEYAVRSEDFEHAVNLVEKHALALFSRGASSELTAWIKRVPDALIVRRPQLPLYICFMFAHSHHPVEAMRRQYERSRHIVSTLHAVGHFRSEDEYQQLLNELEAVSAIIDFRSGDMSRVIASAERIANAQPAIRPIFSAAMYNILGYAQLAMGQNSAARKSLTIARDVHLRVPCALGAVFSDCFTGLVDFTEGKLPNALARFEAAHDYACAELGKDSVLAGIAMLYLALFYYEQDTLSLTSSDLNELLKLCEECCEPEVYTKVLTILYGQYLISGDREGAQRTIEVATSYARKTGHALILLQVRYVEFTNLINAGKVGAAMDVFSDLQSACMTEDILKSDQANRVAYWRDLFRAEIMLCTAQPKKAMKLLDSLLADSLKYNRARRYIFLLSKKAIALASTGRQEEALVNMKTALQKAKSAGFFRTIYDIGPSALELTRQCRQLEDDAEMTVYMDRLLERGADGGNAGPAPLNTVVLQELTHRELDILKQLIVGSKNREICSALELSENTVKWYLKRVYEKLGARNRTEAAMMAKTLFAAL